MSAARVLDAAVAKVEAERSGLHAVKDAPPASDKQEPASDKTGTRAGRVRDAWWARARSIASTLGMAMGALGRSPQQCADRAGISRAVWRKYADPDALSSIHLAALEADPDLARMVYVARLEALSLTVVDDLSIESHARRAASHAGRFNADLETAMADGKLSRDELLELLRDAQRLADVGTGAASAIRRLLEQL